MFGQLRQLQPLPAALKQQWVKDLQCLLAPTEHIVVKVPAVKVCQDGSHVDILTDVPREDVASYLPLLNSIDHQVLAALDLFAHHTDDHAARTPPRHPAPPVSAQTTPPRQPRDATLAEGPAVGTEWLVYAWEFWYDSGGSVAGTPTPQGQASSSSTPTHKSAADGSSRRRQWWVKQPQVSKGGCTHLTYSCLKHLQEQLQLMQQRSSKVAEAVVNRMKVPEGYLKTLPKNAKQVLGDQLYKQITNLRMDIHSIQSTSEAHELACKLEAAHTIWTGTK